MPLWRVRAIGWRFDAAFLAIAGVHAGIRITALDSIAWIILHTFVFDLPAALRLKKRKLVQYAYRI